MRYIVMPKNENPFTTNWFDEANHWTDGMVVIDTESGEYFAGESWEQMEEDHL